MAQPQSHKFRELSRGAWGRAWELYGRYNGRIHLTELGMCLLVAFLIVVMIRRDIGGSALPEYKVGEVAGRTIRATRSVELEDADVASVEKNQILSRVAPVYDHDTDSVKSWIDQWKLTIRGMRSKRSLWTSPKASQLLTEKLGVEVTGDEVKVLASLGYSGDLERSIAFAMGPLWDQKIIDAKNSSTTGIELVELKTSRSQWMKASDMPSLLTVDEARSLVGRAARTESRTRLDRMRMPWSAWNPAVRESVFGLQARMVKANVTLNRKEVENRKTIALKDYRPAMLQLERGEVIVREGEKVSRRASAALAQMRSSEKVNSSAGRLSFETLFGGMSLWLMLLFLRRSYPRLLTKTKDTLVAAAALVTSIAVFKLMLIFMINVIAEYFQSLPAGFFLFLIPAVAPAMILRLLLNTAFATVFSALFGLGTAMILQGGAAFGIHTTVICLIGCHFMRRCRTRTALHVAGLKTAIISGVSALLVVGAWGGEVPLSTNLFSVEAASQLNWAASLGWTFVGGMIGGWLASALTLMLTPILENILDYTTDLKLLELARMDHPLLRDLVMKAPGTYHHSIIVGSLVEAAAEAIGANALLARVGSYYHDIGKVGRAEYFVENQTHGNNPHDHTRPQLSAKIIISHVKEGIQLARAHKLGQSLIDFIEQHHGTSLVSYFFNKAKQEAAQPNSNMSVDDIKEEAFRYPGPKPQSRESAIVALADSCEASTRSLIEPTPARIEGMVKKIISKAFNEGLLDEADITLREVNLVGKAFVRILLGIHHNRIPYPDQEKGLPPTKTISFVKSSTSNDR